MGGIILTSPGYLELLRSNKTFARLWGSNMILYIGDWFTVLAMFLLAGDATDNSPLAIAGVLAVRSFTCLLYTSPSPRDRTRSRMPSSA